MLQIGNQRDYGSTFQLDVHLFGVSSSMDLLYLKCIREKKSTKKIKMKDRTKKKSKHNSEGVSKTGRVMNKKSS